MIDNTSLVALEVVSNLISNLDGTSLSKNVEALSVLKAWKGTNNLNDVAPTIYNKWIYLYLKHFQDELGKRVSISFNYHIMKQMTGQISNDNSLWWDNIDPKQKRNQK
jgi:penicillin amidase